MNKKIDFTNLGGLPADQELFDFMQQSYREGLGAVAKMFGDKVILHGIVKTGSNVSAGWFSYNGELIRFIACTYAPKVTVTETSTALVYDDTISHNVQFEKTATCGIAGDFDFSDFRRLDNIFAALAQMKGFDSYVGTNVPIGDVVGDKFVTINIPDQGTNDYVVKGSLVGFSATPGDDNDVTWTVRTQLNNAFTICVSDLGVSTKVQNLKFNFTITKKID